MICYEHGFEFCQECDPLTVDKFTINIKLGNEAMSHPEHIAEALRRLANRLDMLDRDFLIDGAHLNILDLNGNLVGRTEAE